MNQPTRLHSDWLAAEVARLLPLFRSVRKGLGSSKAALAKSIDELTRLKSIDTEDELEKEYPELFGEVRLARKDPNYALTWDGLPPAAEAIWRVLASAIVLQESRIETDRETVSFYESFLRTLEEEALRMLERFLDFGAVSREEIEDAARDLGIDAPDYFPSLKSSDGESINGGMASAQRASGQSGQVLDAPVEWSVNSELAPSSSSGAEAFQSTSSLPTSSEPANTGVSTGEAVADFGARLEGFTASVGILNGALTGVASSAFEAYADSMGHALATGKFSAAAIGKSARESAKQSLATIGKESAVRGLFEIGYGIKAFATGDADSGKTHLASGAQYMAVAALATGAGGALGGDKGGGSKKKREEVEPAGASSAGTSKGRVTQHITVIGNPTSSSSVVH